MKGSVASISKETNSNLWTPVTPHMNPPMTKHPDSDGPPKYEAEEKEQTIVVNSKERNIGYGLKGQIRYTVKPVLSGHSKEDQN